MLVEGKDGSKCRPGHLDVVLLLPPARNASGHIAWSNTKCRHALACARALLQVLPTLALLHPQRSQRMACLVLAQSTTNGIKSRLRSD